MGTQSSGQFRSTMDEPPYPASASRSAAINSSCSGGSAAGWTANLVGPVCSLRGDEGGAVESHSRAE
jgi:hypothetical protein